MAVPSLTLIPDPPLPTDPEDVFDEHAGNSLTAQKQMVVELNFALNWVSQQVNAVDGYRQAASKSASDAQTYASAANDSKVAAGKSASDATANGKAQVDLAKEQVSLAQQAANAAQVALAAVGAAVGFPTMAGKKGWVLEVNDSETGGVWRTRHRIGEVVITTDTLDTSYVLTGGIYLQSAYPLLFQRLGKLPTPGVYSFQGVANGSGYVITDIDSDGNGTWLAAVSNVTGSGVSLLGYVLRSTDNGKNWTPVAVARLQNSRVRFFGGIWMCVGRSYDSSDSYHYCAHSVDGGATWSLPRRISSGTSTNLTEAFLEVNDTDGLVMLGTFYGSNGYSSWTCRFIPANLGSSTEWSGYSFVSGPFSTSAQSSAAARGMVRIGGFLLVYGTNGALARVSVSATATSTGVVVNSKTSNDLKGGSAKAGTVVIAGTGGVVIRSTDLGASFLPSAVNGTPDFTSVEGVGGGVWLFGASDGNVWISTDDGFTVTKSTPSGLTTQISRMRNSGGVVTLSSGATLRRSESQYSYDPNTQFLVPAVSVPNGLKSYIKAKEAA